MNHIVHKMYEYDKNMAINWTIHLLNKYTLKGLADYNNEYVSETGIMEFIKNLIIDLNKNLSYKEIILLIHNKIEKGFNRFYLWQFLLRSSQFYNYLMNFIEEKLKQNEYKELEELINSIIDNQNFIDEDVFNLVEFLSDIIEHFIDEDFITQDNLDYLYSLIDYVPSDYDKCYLKSLFIDYL